ncbi:MAG: hypothetical protein R2695_08705 [Acidimicrobiales bacterium]
MGENRWTNFQVSSWRSPHEYMLSGLVFNRAVLPRCCSTRRRRRLVDDVAIELWMGASPVYTQRTRDLMGIQGDGVEAIIRTLQLDVGFVHRYMDVTFDVRDDGYAEDSGSITAGPRRRTARQTGLACATRSRTRRSARPRWP